MGHRLGAMTSWGCGIRERLSSHGGDSGGVGVVPVPEGAQPRGLFFLSITEEHQPMTQATAYYSEVGCGASGVLGLIIALEERMTAVSREET